MFEPDKSNRGTPLPFRSAAGTLDERSTRIGAVKQMGGCKMGAQEKNRRMPPHPPPFHGLHLVTLGNMSLERTYTFVRNAYGHGCTELEGNMVPSGQVGRRSSRRERITCRSFSHQCHAMKIAPAPAPLSTFMYVRSLQGEKGGRNPPTDDAAMDSAY